MCYSPVRIEAWLADLAAINRELDAAGHRAPALPPGGGGGFGRSGKSDRRRRAVAGRPTQRRGCRSCLEIAALSC